MSDRPPKFGEESNRWNGGRFVGQDGYVQIYSPGHPRAKNGRYVPEHLLVAEKALGRHIERPNLVHHVNGDPGDNRPRNLVVCQDDAYHMLLHRRQRARDATGDPNALKCAYCNRFDHRKNLYVAPNGRQGRHRSCFNKYQRDQRRKRGSNER